MLTTLGWVLFGFFVYALCILMQALQHRFVPDSVNPETSKRWWNGSLFGDEFSNDFKESGSTTKKTAASSDEIAELKKRIETLEAIVTDRRYQFDDELNRS